MRSNAVLFALALALTLAAPLSAWAETPDAKDVTTIGACLGKLDKGHSAQEVYVSCLMKVARPCMKGDETSVSSRQQIECLGRERAVWDKIINDSYKTMMNALDPDQQVKLREMQRSWIHTRDLTCGFFYDYYQGTMANPMIAFCNNRETARRAIYLRMFAADIAQRK